MHGSEDDIWLGSLALSRTTTSSWVLHLAWVSTGCSGVNGTQSGFNFQLRFFGIIAGGGISSQFWGSIRVSTSSVCFELVPRTGSSLKKTHAGKLHSQGLLVLVFRQKPPQNPAGCPGKQWVMGLKWVLMNRCVGNLFGTVK